MSEKKEIFATRNKDNRIRLFTTDASNPSKPSRTSSSRPLCVTSECASLVPLIHPVPVAPPLELVPRLVPVAVSRFQVVTRASLLNLPSISREGVCRGLGCLCGLWGRHLVLFWPRIVLRRSLIAEECNNLRCRMSRHLVAGSLLGR